MYSDVTDTCVAQHDAAFAVDSVMLIQRALMDLWKDRRIRDTDGSSLVDCQPQNIRQFKDGYTVMKQLREVSPQPQPLAYVQ